MIPLTLFNVSKNVTYSERSKVSIEKLPHGFHEFIYLFFFYKGAQERFNISQNYLSTVNNTIFVSVWFREQKYDVIGNRSINPFVPNAHCLYLLDTSKNLTVF